MAFDVNIGQLGQSIGGTFSGSPISIVANALTIAHAIELNFGSYAYDQVQVLDNSYQQLFWMARPTKANVALYSKLCDHPVESGAIITDFRVIQPVEIELLVICTGYEYQSVYQQVVTAFLKGETVIVQTKVMTFFNMMIYAIPHEEIPEMADVVAMSIRLREVIIIPTIYQSLPPESVQNSSDQSTVNTGTQAPSAPAQTPSPGTAALQILKKAFGIQ